MVELTGFDARAVENCCGKLRKHGLLVKTQRGCHKLTPAGIVAFKQGAKLRSGPKGAHTGRKIVTGTVRERAWSALRITGKGSVPDVIMLAAAGGEKDIAGNIGKYFTALCRAGYLQKLRVRDPGASLTSNGYVRWLLVRNSGPLAPVWRTKAGSVYDPNTEEEHPCG